MLVAHVVDDDHSSWLICVGQQLDELALDRVQVEQLLLEHEQDGHFLNRAETRVTEVHDRVGAVVLRGNHVHTAAINYNSNMKIHL